MSDDREQKTNRNADQTAPDEEVKLHLKEGRRMDESSNAQDEDNDVEAHVKNKL